MHPLITAAVAHQVIGERVEAAGAARRFARARRLGRRAPAPSIPGA